MKFWTAALAVVGTTVAASGANGETLAGTQSADSSAILPPEAAFTGTSLASASHGAGDGQSYAKPDAEADRVHGTLTPYLWMAGINGDVGIPRGDGEAEVDRSFGDILGDLKFAFMGAMELEYRRVVVHADTIYLNLGVEVERPDSLVFTEGELDAKMLIATGAIGYRVVDHGPMYVDLYAGARLVSLDLDLSLTGPLQTRETGASPSNVSPLIGGKAQVPLGGRWGLALQGDIGFDSDVKWQASGTVQYNFSERWRMGLGYRHLALQHDKGDREIDIAFSGPLLAFSYIF